MEIGSREDMAIGRLRKSGGSAWAQFVTVVVDKPMPARDFAHRLYAKGARYSCLSCAATHGRAQQGCSVEAEGKLMDSLVVTQRISKCCLSRVEYEES